MSTRAIPRAAERKGPRIRVTHLVILVLLLPVLAHLFYAISRSPLTDYYMTLDELAARGPGARVRVGATVVPGSIDWDNRTRTVTFEIQDNGRVLPVVYRGYAPDSLRDDAETIVEGEWNRDGTFTADSVLLKCPHKYAI